MSNSIVRTYPKELPQYVETNGYTEGISRADVITTEMDTGPAKFRRRSQSKRIPFTCNLVLSLSQVEIFKDWYNNTLVGGVMPFEWVHPITRSPAYFQFTNPAESPSLSPWNNAGDRFQTTLNISMLP